MSRPWRVGGVPVLAPVDTGSRRELGPDAVDAFTETKNVFIAIEI